MKQHIIKSASIAETGFFSKFKVLQDSPSAMSLGVFQHGQYKGCGVKGWCSVYRRMSCFLLCICSAAANCCFLIRM